MNNSWDYWLGGKDNFAADREMGGRMAGLNPALPDLVRHNRDFICAAAARAAEAGIGRFLDLGSGLPTHPAVHEAVREVNPGARVCYVDIDPVAVVHARALLALGEGLVAVQADLTEPQAVPAFLPPEAAAVCAQYMDQAAEGSWLIVTSGHYEDKDLAGRLQQAATHTRFYNHDAAALASMLGGLDPVGPGVAEARRWLAGTGGEPSGKPVYALAAVGTKTR